MISKIMSCFELDENIIKRDEIILELRKENLKLKKEVKEKNKLIAELSKKKSVCKVAKKEIVPGQVPQESSFFCRICVLQCSSKKQLAEHLGGKKHADNVDFMKKTKCKFGKNCRRHGCLFLHQ